MRLSPPQMLWCFTVTPNNVRRRWYERNRFCIWVVLVIWVGMMWICLPKTPVGIKHKIVYCWIIKLNHAGMWNRKNQSRVFFPEKEPSGYFTCSRCRRWSKDSSPFLDYVVAPEPCKFPLSQWCKTGSVLADHFPWVKGRSQSHWDALLGAGVGARAEAGIGMFPRNRSSSKKRQKHFLGPHSWNQRPPYSTLVVIVEYR